MSDVMKKLRLPLESLRTAELPVSRRTDYLLDDTGLPKSDVLEFILSENDKFIIRPSGTEPKLKAYLFARGQNQAEAEEALNRFEKSIRILCE